MEHAFAKNFTARDIVKFAMPNVAMMLFLSVYTTIDGVFATKFVSEDALASINIVFPVITLVMALALMLVTGSSAIVSRKMGEGKSDEARSFLTLVYLVGILLGIISTVLLLVFRTPMMEFLGTSEQLYPYVFDYYTIISASALMLVLQIFSQQFFTVAGHPTLGLAMCIIGGLTNVILDYLFIVVFHWGIAGAALATGVSYAIPGIAGVIYFLFWRKDVLHFVTPKWNGCELVESCLNGSSEFVSNISTSITNIFFNRILLELANESGVAAISVILYIQMFQMAIYLGYAIGISPIIGYKYGAQDTPQLRRIMSTSFHFIFWASLLVIALSQLLSIPAVSIFVEPSSPTFPLAVHGLRIFSIAYLFMGFNIFASAMFTAFGNGKISAFLSALRTLIFTVGALSVLPNTPLGLDGVWLAVPVAELLTLFVSGYCFVANRKHYHY